MVELARPVACPDDNELLAMVEHSLDPDAFGVIEAHLDGCAHCRQTVAALVRRPSSEKIEPGDAISERYHIVRELGRGGMGTVYLARDRTLGRDVALKLHLAGSGHDRGARLHREAVAMAKLAHPNVVTVFEVGNLEDRLYVAMEYVPGGTLRAWLAGGADGQRRPWREVLALLVDAGQGLAAAHAAGLVHRDFKPENVLVGEDGRPRVGDFGLARVRGELPATPGAGTGSGSGSTGRGVVRATAHAAGTVSDSVLGSEPTLAVGSQLDAPLTRTGAVMGTPAYMAPEQLAGGEIDARCDQFAFCVVAWECLFGARPFTGKSIVELALAIERRELSRPDRTDVPDRVRAVLERGLATDPDARYRDLPALLAALRAAAAPRTRRRVAFAAAALVAVAGGGLVLASNVQSHRRAAACERAADDVRAVFDAGARERLHAAFVASGSPISESAFQHTAAVLERQAATLATATAATCGATDPAGVARRACLAQRTRDLATFLDVLGHVDVEGVTRAPGAAWALFDPAPCSGTRTAVTADPALGERLGRARALVDAGRYADAAKLADELISESEHAGNRNAELDARMLGADAHAELEPPAQTATRYNDVLALAERQGRDLDAATALDRLANLAGTDRQDFSEAHRFLELAHAKLERLGDANVAVRGSLALTEAQIAYEEFKLDVAERAARAALAAFTEAYGEGHPKVGSALGTLSQVLRAEGKRDEALAAARRTLAVLGETLGPEHPTVAGAHMNLGMLLMDSGQYADAHAELVRADDGFAKALGPDHPMLGPLRSNFAELALQQHDGPGAERAFREVLAIAERAGASPADLSGIHRDIARALAMQDKQDAALAEDVRAVEMLEKLGADGQTRLLAALTEEAQRQIDRHQPQLAIPLLERALATTQSAEAADPVELAEARFELAFALREAHRDPARAKKLAEQARDAHPDAARRAVIDAWLKAR